MKKTRFSESQIVAILKEVELGAKVGETCRKHGVSEPTYYKWKNQYSGMTVPHLSQLRELQDELGLSMLFVTHNLPLVRSLAQRVVVMAERGRDILTRVYAANPRQIAMIPHGVPDRELVDPSLLKPRFGWADREVADVEGRTVGIVGVGGIGRHVARLAAAFGLPSLSQDAFAVIWTTTAWTIPANQALNMHAELSYALVETPKGLLVLAESLVEKATQRYGFEADQVKVLATTVGAKLEGLRFKHPLAHVDAGYDQAIDVARAKHVHVPMLDNGDYL